MFVSNGSLVTKSPVDLDTSSYFPYMPGMSSSAWPSAYASLYRTQLWVYTVVAKRARATARLPLPVYQRDDLNRPRADDHPMARLLHKPNAAMSGFDLWLWTSSTYDIFGEAFWFKQRARGEVRGLFPLHPSSMHYDDQTGVWSFDNGKLTLPKIEDRDLVRFRSFHPGSLVRGLSPLEPLRSTLENEWHARRATSSFWERGARPGTYLVHKANLSQPAQARLKAQFDSVGAGSSNTGATIVLEEGMEPKAMTLSAEEAQYIETRKLNREEVCAAYDMPPPAVHILDRATFSNITEQFRSVYRDTMAPHLHGFEAVIERDLRSVEWPADDIYAEFLMDEVLRGDFETRQAALKSADHYTIAEKRRIENLPFIEGTDRIFLNTATMPLDEIGVTTTDADARNIAEMVQKIYLGVGKVISEDEARAILNRAGADLRDDFTPAPALSLSDSRSIAGRLSWQTELDQVEPRPLIEGLDETAAGHVLHALALEKARGGGVASLRERVRALVKEPEHA